MWEPSASKASQKQNTPPPSADTAPVASSSRVQLSGDRSISEADVAALSKTQRKPTLSRSTAFPSSSILKIDAALSEMERMLSRSRLSASSPTHPSSRHKKDKQRPHPYKRATVPLTMHPVSIKREEETSAESESTKSNSNWLDKGMKESEPEETKCGPQSQTPSFIH
jgi:hypothetical protein